MSQSRQFLDSSQSNKQQLDLLQASAPFCGQTPRVEREKDHTDGHEPSKQAAVFFSAVNMPRASLMH